MNAQQNVAFHNLLVTWKRRDDLRSAGADVRELGAARVALEEARGEMSRALAPAR